LSRTKHKPGTRHADGRVWYANQWCTQAQIDAHRSKMRKGKAKGVKAEATAAPPLKRLKKRAAVVGYAPAHDYTRPVPEPFRAKGVSTYYDRHGNPTGQWVKSTLSEMAAQEVMRLTVEELLRDVKPAEPLPMPDFAEDDLCNVYLLGDPHIGMLAWGKETGGEDYDLRIAEDWHTRAIQVLVGSSPKAGHAVVANMGDALHADNYSFLTQSGNRLDADSRYPRAVSVAVRTFTTLGECVLQAHNSVDWKNVNGNHDRNIAPWLDAVLCAHWRNESRMSIDMSPESCLYTKFGVNLLGFTHGDRLRAKFKENAKPRTVQEFIAVMMNDRRADFATATTVAAFQGHIHSENEVEGAGGSLRSVQTVAPGDAWHAAQRYRSGKSMSRVTYHRRYGEISRGRVPIAMLQESER
jgi:hypothetical protein